MIQVIPALVEFLQSGGECGEVGGRTAFDAAENAGLIVEGLIEISSVTVAAVAFLLSYYDTLARAPTSIFVSARKIPSR